MHFGFSVLALIAAGAYLAAGGLYRAFEVRAR